MSDKPTNRREGFNYADFLERVLDESDNRENFPLKVRHNSCDRVQLPLEELNAAAEKGDWDKVTQLRAQLVVVLDAMEGEG